MFIRQTKTRSNNSGGSYFTHRLVESKRIGNKVRQRTLLNLGSHFDLSKDLWTDLCTRIEQILHGEQALFTVDPGIEKIAQDIYAQIIARRGNPGPQESPDDAAEEPVFEEIDINSLEQLKPRSVGAEHVALEALKDLQIPEILEGAGFNGRQRAEALGNIVGRMCAPRSERATAKWLHEKSAFGELINYDFSTMPLMQLYRASDRLWDKKELIEEKLFERVQDLFDLTPTITLYDLTNTYMEGAAEINPKAKRGRSKEKRSDCPLITLGLALDASGFVKHSQVFDGNVNEGSTLPEMLEKLQAPDGALVIMDAGIASEDNLKWLVENNYQYLVVSREKKRDINMEKTTVIESAGNHEIHLQRQAGTHDGEVRIACWSEQRAAKDKSITSTFRDKFETELTKISEGLVKPRTTKKRDPLNQRIGRLKEKYKRVSGQYEIEVKVDQAADLVTELTWKYRPKPDTKDTHPGVYKLRTTLVDWTDEELWRTYTMLTDLEAVFRSLKSELGLRPVYHHQEDRCDGHLFITVLAYQAVQAIRQKLQERGIHESWNSLREILNQQVRVTATFKQRDGKTLHVRQATRPEGELAEIYQALGLSPAPGGQQRMTV